jgi:hypothetical protein
MPDGLTTDLLQRSVTAADLDPVVHDGRGQSAAAG